MQAHRTDGSISRRAFVGRVVGIGASTAGLVLASGCALLPGAASKHVRVGILTGGVAPSAPAWQAFLSSLRGYGWVEGQNLALDWRVDLDALAEDAAELVRAPVDVIVAAGSASFAAKAATSTIPIVLAHVGQPVETGLVSSLAQPGGNVTGVAASASGPGSPSLPIKSLDFAKQVVPTLTRACHLGDFAGPLGQLTADQLLIAGESLGVQVQLLRVQSADKLEETFSGAGAWGAQALIIGNSTLFFSGGYQRLPQLAARQHLPDFYFPRREYVDAGGLMSYGPNIPNQHRRVAYFVDRILRGARPGDLPIEQPSVYELVVNVKTAQALGMTIPPEVAEQVTEWIQ